MSKQADNDPKLASNHKLLSQAMTLIYISEANILLLKCLCCNKFVAYCCDCNPVLEKIAPENNYQVNNINKLHNNIIVPIFEGHSIKEVEKDNINIKDNNKNNININGENISTIEIKPTTKNNFDVVENNLQNKTIPSNGSEPSAISKDKIISPKHENSNLQSQSAIMEFCYRVETKIGEINLGANYYQILELGYKASKLEIQEAYISSLLEFNLDRIKNISIPKENLEKQIDIVTNNINIAATTLLNDSLRENYDKKIFEYLANKNITKDVIYSQGSSINNKKTSISNSKILNKEIPNNLAGKDKSTSQPIISLQKTNQQNNVNLPPKLTKNTPNIVNKIITDTLKTNQINIHSKIKENNDESNEFNEKSLADVELNTTSDSLAIQNDSKNKLLNNQILVQAKPADYKILDKRNKTMVTGYAIKKEQLNDTKKEIPVAKDLYNLSLKFHDALNYERSVTTLQKALELDNNNSLYWYQLGKTYSKVHNLKHRAENSFKEAIKLDPENTEYLTNLAELYQELGKDEQAARIFQKVFQLKYKKHSLYKKITELIQRIKSFFEKRQEISLKQQNKIKETFSYYLKQTISFIKIFFIVIRYKLRKQKEK
ncbi:MAG: tetratricopeptide repeat protein [Acidobacteria bacterium]|nr:tetratricopeptide repeat protein [Acidobacteriota bacterium]